MKSVIAAVVVIALAPAAGGIGIAVFANPVDAILGGGPAPCATSSPTAGSENEASYGACDDYPWPNEKTIGEGGSLSPLGYYYRECVDFVAWRLNRDAGTTTAPWKYTWARLTPLGGDAIDWKQNWIAHGWTISSTPHPGWVAWWGTKGGPQGHVAYVQAVNGDGTINIEEYNWGGKHAYDTRTIRADVPDAFLAPPGIGLA